MWTLLKLFARLIRRRDSESVMIAIIELEGWLTDRDCLDAADFLKCCHEFRTKHRA